MTSEIPSDAPIVHGRDLERGFREACDVVVVGSGASGMTVATILAEAGLDVLVLEEGPYYRHEDIGRFEPSTSLRRLFREAGMLAAVGIGQTPIISLTLGRAVGGSSLLTGGVCYRIPGAVHRRWVDELGLDAVSERALEPAYEEVERRMAVTEVPAAMRSESSNRFVAGAERLGYTMRSLRRNTGDQCEGNARCNFGCPAGAKRSVDVSYLPSLVSHGGRVVSDALVERILVENGRAAGVAGRLLGGRFGAPSQHFEVAAKAVVVCSGTLHTPQLLRGLGLRSHGLGRFITLHPAARVVATFRDRIDGWNGALQSCYSDDLESEGILFNGVYTAVNVIAAGLPGIGSSLLERTRKLGHLAMFGTMVHDEAGGHVTAGLGREPTLVYEMAPLDLQRLKKGMRVLAEMALEAGAEEVILPIFGMPAITSRKAALAVEHDPLDARRIECLAFHPLGSARMANDARRGTVDEHGESFEARGLYVADGSILPTSIGVNSQVPIMAMATRIAWGLRDRLVG
ncbi:MAG: GMC family oxidoreductase [Deltaproteobacteria bacterium]|nr:GMC family oxidoreductase [Deltaproteobacteria bacterium]